MKLSDVAPSGDAPSKMKLSDLVDQATGHVSSALKSAREAVAGDEIPGALYNGLTLGFGKDIDAGLAGLGTRAKNLVTRGKEDPTEVGAAVKQAEKEKQTKFGNEHPVGHLATEFTGGMLIPGLKQANAALKGAGMASGLGRGMTMGAGLGGAAAAGNSDGDLLDRLKAVPGGAGAGAVAGGLLHGGGKLAGRLGHGLSESFSRMKTGVEELLDIGSGGPGEMTPKRLAKGEKAGTQYVADLAKKLDPTGKKLSASAAELAGKPITAAEALGRPAQTQLKVLGRRAGKTPDELSAQLTQRQREAGQRVVDDFYEVTGVDPEAARGDLTKQTDAMREKAAPLYKAWHAQEGVDSEELQALRKTKQFKDAIGHAKGFISADRENAYELGLEEKDLPLMFKDPRTGRAAPVMRGGQPIMVPRETAITEAKKQGFEHPGANTEKDPVPTAKGYDYVKRGLDEELEQFRDKATGRLNLSSPKAKALMKVRGELADELTNPSQPWGPAAKAAFEAGGDPIRQEEAFNSAKALLSNNLRGWQFDKKLERYTPAQREALKAGVVSEVREAAQAGRTRLRELLTDSTVLKLQHIFGPEQATKLVERLTMESDMAKTGARMAPGVGSDTSETLLGAGEQASGMQDAARAIKSLGRGKWTESLMHVISAPLVGAYRGAQAPINEASRDMAGALLRKSPSELARVLEAHGATKEEASKAVQILRSHGAFAASLFAPAASAATGASQAHRN